MISFVSYNKVMILQNHMLFNYFFLFLEYLLNFIPTWVSHIKSKEKPIKNKFTKENTLSIEYLYNEPYEKYLSKKDMIKFIFFCLFPILITLIQIIQYKMDIEEVKDETKHNNDKIKESDDKEKTNYNDDFIIIEIIIFFIASRFDKEVYYKHKYFIPFFNFSRNH